jgi:predicted aspartyl protease
MKTNFYSLAVAGAVVGVLGLSLLTGCVNGGSTVTTEQPLQFAGSGVELDLKLIGNHFIVEGDISSYGTKNFIIDTGSQINVLDTAIVQAMGLEKIGEMEVMSGGTDPLQAGIYIVPQLKLGDLIVKDAEFLAMELDGMSRGLVQGVLGMPLFSDFLLTIDSPHDKLKVSRSSLSPDDPFVVPLDGSDSYLGVQTKVAGQDVTMVIDVGAPGGFTLPENIAETVPLHDGWKNAGTARLVGGERSLKNGVLDGDIMLAGIRYKNPGVAIISPSPDHGNIGNAILKDIILKVDQKNGLLSFEKVAPVE